MINWGFDLRVKRIWRLRGLEVKRFGGLEIRDFEKGIFIGETIDYFYLNELG